MRLVRQGAWQKNLLQLMLVSTIQCLSTCFSFVVLISLLFSDTQAEDQPRGPPAASDIDQTPQETLQKEVDKSTKGAAFVACRILGCQSVLAVSSLVFEYLCMLSSGYMKLS